VSKRMLFWAGYSEGKPLVINVQDTYSEPGRATELFTTRKAARARFCDVRRVEVREVRAAKRKEAK